MAEWVEKSPLAGETGRDLYPDALPVVGERKHLLRVALSLNMTSESTLVRTLSGSPRVGMCMAYIPLLRMRVKTEVQSVIARRRSCTDSKDPDAGSKRGSVPASPAHPACMPLSPLHVSYRQ